MPIEFRCTRCQKLLRTGDETAGKQAKCPECGEVTLVPASTPGLPSEAAPAASPFPPSQEGPSSSPFGPAEGQPPSPFSPGGGPPAPGGENPYEAPTQAGQPPQYPYPAGAYAGPSPAQRVAGPAIALIVTGAIGIVGQIVSIFFNLFFGAMMMQGPRRPANPAFDMPPELNVSFGVIGLIIGIVILLGAIRMKNLESHGFSMAAAILAMIPCISPCCILGLPFGIWALVVLSDDQVKAAFRG